MLNSKKNNGIALYLQVYRLDRIDYLSNVWDQFSNV